MRRRRRGIDRHGARRDGAGRRHRAPAHRTTGRHRSTDRPPKRRRDTTAPGTTPAVPAVASWKACAARRPGLDVGDWIDGVNDFWVAKGNAALTDFNYAAETLRRRHRHRPGRRGGRHRRQRARRRDQRRHQGRREVHRPSPTAWRSSRPVATPTTTASPARSTSTATVNHSPGSYAVLEFGADNRLDSPVETYVQAEAPESAIVDQVPVGVEREGDGVLKIGSLLPADRQPGLPRTTGVRRPRVRDRRDQRRGWRARRTESSTRRATRATPAPTSPASRPTGSSARASTPSSVPPRRASR